VASDGFERILDIEPDELHQRTAVYIGSMEMVQMVERLLSEETTIREGFKIKVG
jgi:fructose-1,6-bisphosphatase I